MKVYFDFPQVSLGQNLVLSVGYFDGLHIGHQTLIQKIVDYKNSHFEFKSLIFSFQNYPLAFIKGNNIPTQNIYSVFQKIEAFSVYKDLDYLYLPTFDQWMMTLSAHEFILKIKQYVSGNIHFIMGKGFHFGFKRSGNAQTLKQMMSSNPFLSFEEIDLYSEHNVIISSSYLRQWIMQGEISKANQYLKIPYHFTGEVIQGLQQGKLIHYPTINILPSQDRIFPKEGTYQGIVKIQGQQFSSLIYISKLSLQIRTDTIQKIEAWIKDFDRDVYGQWVQIFPEDFIAAPQQFDSLEDLQIFINKMRKRLSF